MRIGYNTNGFGFHRLSDALQIIGDLGYRGVAITIDHHALNPWDGALDRQISSTADLLKRYGMGCVIETGARFLLNPREKHAPTLVSKDPAGRAYRLDFLKRALAIGAALDAEALSFWAGVKPAGVPDASAWQWLVDGCRRLALAAEAYRLPLAFEPEPGMFIETLDQYGRLKSQVDHPGFGLTLDLGHAFLMEPEPPHACLRHWAGDIRNIHLEDMRPGRHRHLFFGEGEIRFGEIFSSLARINYTGLVNIELSRHSHKAVTTADRALAWVNRLVAGIG
jgi:L-ribulose-5-phosphate 3-epimerase